MIQNILFANQMTQNTLFNGIYGVGWKKNHNIDAWRTWSRVRLRLESFKRLVEACCLRCSMSPSCRDWQTDAFDYVVVVVVVVVVVDAFLQFSMSCKDWQADWGAACQSVKLKICWMVNSSPAAQHSGIHAKGGRGWVVQLFFWYFFPTPNT